MSDYICCNCGKAVPENAPCPHCASRVAQFLRSIGAPPSSVERNPMSVMTDEERTAWHAYRSSLSHEPEPSIIPHWLAGRRSAPTIEALAAAYKERGDALKVVVGIVAPNLWKYPMPPYGKNPIDQAAVKINAAEARIAELTKEATDGNEK